MDENIEGGAIWLYRKLRTWRWYHDSNMVHLFIELLLRAQYEPGSWKDVILEKGQCIVGRHALTESTGISDRTLRTCLGRLKWSNEVTIKSTNKYSILTICNYSRYQCKKCKVDQQNDQQNDQPTTSNRPATDHIQEDKKIRKKEYYYKGKKLPTEREMIGDPPVEGDGYLPDPLKDFFLSQGKIEVGVNVYMKPQEWEKLLAQIGEERCDKLLADMGAWSRSLDISAKGIPHWKSYRQKRDHYKTILNKIKRDESK